MTVAEQSELNKDKERNSRGSDTSVCASSGVGKYGTVKAPVELQQEQDVLQGKNQQPESLEKQEEEEEHTQPEQRGQYVSRTI